MKKRDVINSVRRMIEMETMAGVKEICVAEPAGKGKTNGRRQGMKDRKRQRTEKDKITLEGLKKKVLACRRCPLARSRTNVVFGEGSARAGLMFIGEAPGSEEDRQGRPFVGHAGQLLTRIIESIGLKREDVYIANILKCRPPGNRDPLPDEIAICSPYLIEQIELIRPKVICALGKFAAQTLLSTDTPITKLRGRFYDYREIKLMPTYHPAYLLRNPEGKKDVWADMRVVAKELGLEIPRRRRRVG